MSDKYKPQALDVDKMGGMFDSLEKVQTQQAGLARIEIESYDKGYKKALDDARSALQSNMYEFKPSVATDTPAAISSDSQDTVKQVLYQLCKELGIDGSDIYETDLSIEIKCAELAKRITKILSKS